MIVAVVSDRAPRDFDTIRDAIEARLKERLGVRIRAEVVVPVCAAIEAEIAQLDESERAEFLADGQGTIIVRTIVSTLFKTGLDGLKARFGAAK